MNGFQIATDDRNFASEAVQPIDGLEPHVPPLQPAAGDKARAGKYFESGTEHYANCQYGPAIADFDRAIGHDPQNAGAHNSRGLAHYANGDLRRAIADFDEALRLDPQIADAYYNRGSALSDRGRHERAIADFDRALAIDPSLHLAANRKWLAEENLAAQSPQIQQNPPKQKKGWFGLGWR